MNEEIIQRLRLRLIEKTKENELHWRPISTLEDVSSINEQLSAGKNMPDFSINSVRLSNSYYLEYEEGILYLFEIFHGNPMVTSPEMDTVALMAKVNRESTIDNLSIYDELEQVQLRTLQLMIESYLEDNEDHEEALNSFLNHIIEGKNDGSKKATILAHIGGKIVEANMDLSAFSKNTDGKRLHGPFAAPQSACEEGNTRWAKAARRTAVLGKSLVNKNKKKK